MTNISEPVLTLIELFEDNPRRFKIVKRERVDDYSPAIILIEDRVSGTVFEAREHYSGVITAGRNTGWMTRDEFRSCEWHIRNYLHKRKQRKQKLLDERRIKREEARDKAMRSYYMNMYCGKEEG